MSVSELPRHVLAIMAELSDAERASVADLADRLGVPMAVWPARGAFRGWVDLAVLRAVDKALASSKARSRKHALRLIAGEFLLSEDALLKRHQQGKKSPPRAPSGSVASVTHTNTTEARR